MIPEQIKDDSAVEDFPEDDIDSLSSSEASLGDSPEIAKSNTVSNEAASARMMDFGGNDCQFSAIHIHLEIGSITNQTGKDWFSHSSTCKF